MDDGISSISKVEGTDGWVFQDVENVKERLKNYDRILTENIELKLERSHHGWIVKKFEQSSAHITIYTYVRMQSLSPLHNLP